MDPIYLTREHVKASARQAYVEGRLGFQNPDIHRGRCLYRYGGVTSYSAHTIGCAIGVSMTDAQIEDLRECGKLSAGVVRLFKEGIIVANGDDESFLSELQSAHDMLINKHVSDIEGSEALADLKALIGL